MRSIEVDTPGCLSPFEGIMLTKLSQNCDNNIINIGCYKGRSLKYIINGDPRGHIFGIDINPRHNFLKPFSDNPNVTIIAGSSYDRSILSDPRLQNIDLVFIDGDHAHDGCLADLENYWVKLNSGGVMMVHDVFDTNGVQHEPEVNQAFMRFAREHTHEFVYDSWYCGTIHKLDSCAMVQKI